MNANILQLVFKLVQFIEDFVSTHNHSTKNIKMLKTSSNNIKLLLLSNIFTSFVVSSSQVVSTWKMNEPGCEGSLVIFDTSNQKHTIGKDNDFLVDKMNIEVRSLHVEGCGCFRVNKGEKGRGQSKKIDSGGKLSQKEVGFKKIKSARRILCQVKAQPSWLVIVIVIVSVVIVLGLALVAIKCYRSRFSRLPQEDSA